MQQNLETTDYLAKIIKMPRGIILNKVSWNSFVLVLFLCFCSPHAYTQTPFNTDNTDVTEKDKFHLEITNEYDRLQPTSSPDTFQNGTRLTVAYGLIKNVEISLTGQYLGLGSSQHPRLIGGVGDTTLGVKYNFYKENRDSILPGLTISSYVQFPTGSVRRGLGTGIRDVGINGIAQKSFSKNNIFRVNGGILFSGNTLTGVIGIAKVRGKVFTGGFSYVRTISEKLQLGGEITGAVAGSFQLSKGQLQTQLGGNYQVGKNTTLDFGLIAGRFAASPRIGLVLGFSHDF